MIYITGDCHRQLNRFNTGSFPEQYEMNKDDYVIICGDFGCVWDKGGESKEEKYLLDWLEDKSFTTLFVDGNHENFDRLCSMRVDAWHGGKVHFLRPSVIHLMRGQIYDIDGASIFAFGGAQSHDIQGGILERFDPEFKSKRRWLNRAMIPYRINHESWWKEELPSDEEMREGMKNLKSHDFDVDFIVTHCVSSSTQAIFGAGLFKPDILTDYFEEVKQKTKYKKWFFGHYHRNMNVTAEEIMLYEQIIRVR